MIAASVSILDMSRVAAGISDPLLDRFTDRDERIHAEVADEYAATYDEKENTPGTRSYKRREEELVLVTVQAMRSGRPVKVLDVGCGTGRFERLLSPLDKTSAVGLDFSPAMLAEARKNVPGPSARFVQANARALPFPSDSFDVAILGFGLVSYAGPQAVQEAVRVLRPGGRIILSAYNRLGYHVVGKHLPWLAAMPASLDVETNMMTVNGRGFRCEGHTRQSLALLAEAAGLRVESVESLPMLHSFLPETELFHLVSGNRSPWDVRREELELVLDAADSVLLSVDPERGMYLLLAGVK